jgi:hypothetical protein
MSQVVRLKTNERGLTSPVNATLQFSLQQSLDSRNPSFGRSIT